MRTRTTLMGADVIALSVAFSLSFYWFRMDAVIFLSLFLSFLCIKMIIFGRMGLYRTILQFAGLPFASTILKATSISLVLCYLAAHLLERHTLPFGFYITDYLITTFLIGLTRFAPRYFSEFGQEAGTRRILIYGAGELGEEVARKILRNPGEYKLVGFLDDEPSKIGKRLHNFPVYGPFERLSVTLTQHRISEVILAIPSPSGETVRNITHECRRNGAFCRIVPSFQDLLNKEINIKNIDISDLLKREPKDLDEPQIRRFICGRTILITGAGGSIGSELSRQCIRYGAKKLILVDHSEFNLYSLQEELSRSSIPIRYCLVNIIGDLGLDKVFQEEGPSIVFHAAAYKHVPVVEENPFEGFYNNVQGTIQTAQLSQKYGVEKCVLISTDKAVRPTSIMGASKRIAELYVQNLNSRSKTEYVSVRFGNVLGSSGSVIPKFIEQINKGGPVTVTHPEVTRYFMLTSEAVQLVLQAASIGNGGEIFILNMGNPVRIAEMAEDLIFLSGRKPHSDVQIEYTGLRPGEKLYEELLHDETEKKTQYENITIGRTTHANWSWLINQIENITNHIRNQNRIGLLNSIKQLVPEFTHSELKPVCAENIISLHLKAKSS